MFDKSNPPSEEQFRLLKLKVFITAEIDKNNKLISMYSDYADAYRSQIQFYTDRNKTLIQARMCLLQNEPLKSVEELIGTHYSTFLQQYI